MSGHRPIIILSDDITGASGVASMIDDGATVTINIDNLDSSIDAGHECVCVNLGIRESGVLECRRILRSALKFAGNEIIALRIDSALRGPIGQQVEAFLKRGNLLVTDTLPEYRRYTLARSYDPRKKSDRYQSGTNQFFQQLWKRNQDC